jgi:hypothetical protein
MNDAQQQIGSQALFLANMANLKTRVSLSFFDHPKIRSKEVAYTIRLADEAGKLVYERQATIHRKQTHTFDCADLLAGKSVRCGLFLLDAAEPQLGSLRVYACWYNDHSMTTTHEKAAIESRSSLMIAPTIVSSATLETYLGITNLESAGPLTCECQLINANGAAHPNLITVNIRPEGTVLLPLTPYFADLATFLGGKPGALYVRNNKVRALYYYFIENKRLGTWQIQHL